MLAAQLSKEDYIRGVRNAIYLIGSKAYRITKDTNGVMHSIGTKTPNTYEYINYIWTKG